ncbi:PKS-ER domain-containing protein [Fusarium falciforme]|uniref:PKS-ER domain-containing protein n=1 Tax=Fusarium falciforme TaxID=195108 RepID=UPI0023018631|nr:PKS-ER domain-containing protein [Fusarium falciforme]WAO95372.1 PKS-ER domain-containing protein [Fusarium falciforme]
MPETQTAAVVERFGEPYILKQIPRPENPKGPDLLIKVLAASYCHTDAVFAAGLLSQDLPRIGCHEFAGEVVAVGPEVRGIVVGQRVGVPGRAYHPCGSCYECTHPGQDEMGYSPYCPQAGNLGLTRDGGFQEYCLVDSRQIAPLPESLHATQAAPLMCAGLTIWSALQHEKALQLVQQVKADLGEAGKRVHISDARSKDPETMKSMGCSTAGIAPTEIGLDAVILLPESQRAFDMGMKLLRNHGTMVVVSFPKDKLSVSAHDLVFRDIAVVGSLVGRNHQLREMLGFVVKHQVQVRVKTFPFDQLNELGEQSHQGEGGKLVIDMTLG